MIGSIITQTLVEIYQVVGDLGLAIIIFTLLIRSLLLPLTIPSIKAQKKMRELKPEIDKLKKKHKKDKTKLQKAQLDLYKKYNVNPLAGCIPQLVQIGLLIVLYRVLITFLNEPMIDGTAIETAFFWLDLAQPDSAYVLPVLAAVSQLALSVMILPGGEKRDIVPNDSKSKKVAKENEKEEDFAEMAATMQQQMLFLMPIMTGFIAARFPSGLALYWVVTTLFSIGQQLVLSGPGGLITYAERAQNFVQKQIGRLQ